MRSDLHRRGYTLDTTTRAMGMALDNIRLPRPQIDLGPPDWPQYLRLVGVSPTFISRADPSAYLGRIVEYVPQRQRRATATAAAPPARSAERAPRQRRTAERRPAAEDQRVAPAARARWALAGESGEVGAAPP
jgi:hypothetical protein